MGRNIAAPIGCSFFVIVHISGHLHLDPNLVVQADGIASFTTVADLVHGRHFTEMPTGPQGIQRSGAFAGLALGAAVDTPIVIGPGITVLLQHTAFRLAASLVLNVHEPITVVICPMHIVLVGLVSGRLAILLGNILFSIFVPGHSLARLHVHQMGAWSKILQLGKIRGIRIVPGAGCNLFIVTDEQRIQLAVHQAHQLVSLLGVLRRRFLPDGVAHIRIAFCGGGHIATLPEGLFKGVLQLLQLFCLLASGSCHLPQVLDLTIDFLEHIWIVDRKVVDELGIGEQIITDHVRHGFLLDLRQTVLTGVAGLIGIHIMGRFQPVLVLSGAFCIFKCNVLEGIIKTASLQRMGDLMAHQRMQVLLGLGIDDHLVCSGIVEAVGGIAIKDKAGFLQLLVAGEIKINSGVGRNLRHEIHELMGLSGIVQYAAVDGLLNDCPFLLTVLVQIRFKLHAIPGIFPVALAKPRVLYLIEHGLTELLLQLSTLGILQKGLSMALKLFAFVKLCQLRQGLILFRDRILQCGKVIAAQDLFDGVQGNLATLQSFFNLGLDVCLLFRSQLLAVLLHLGDPVFHFLLHHGLVIFRHSGNEVSLGFIGNIQAGSLGNAAGHSANNELLQQVFVLQDLTQLRVGHIGHLLANRLGNTGKYFFQTFCTGLDAILSKILCDLVLKQTGYLFRQHIIST